MVKTSKNLIFQKWKMNDVLINIITQNQQKYFEIMSFLFEFLYEF